MTTRTITVEALAAVLHAADRRPALSGPFHTPTCEERAAAIFAALPAEPALTLNPETVEALDRIFPAEPADAGLREAADPKHWQPVDGRLALHSDDDDCQPPHVHRHHWVDVLYPGDKVWFYCTGCEERRIKPALAATPVEEGE